MPVNELERFDNIREDPVRGRYDPTYWGRIPKFEIPASIIQNDHLILSGKALAMLMILAQSAKAAIRARSRQLPWVEVTMTQDLLAERSGYRKNSITAGMGELKAKRFILPSRGERRGGQFGVNAYLLCNPVTGEPLTSTGTNFYYRNQVPYLHLPVCVVKETSADWSLASMTSSEVRLYLALCWLGNKNRTGKFLSKPSDLKRTASLSTRDTMLTALDSLEGMRLVGVERGGGGMWEIELLDPLTGEPPHVETGDSHDAPASYRAIRQRGREVPLNLNAGTPEQMLELLMESLPAGDPMRPQSNGNRMIRCPFHADNNPSCSVDPVRRIYHCFGCDKSGRLRELIAKLRGISMGDSIELMGRRVGEQVVYRDPDENAEAIYSYYRENGKLVKQVLRCPGKRFLQRRPASGGGWIWNLDGIPPMLYNLHRLQNARVVCICEGEKDCEIFDRLSLHSALGGDVVPTTSGGVESWHDELADALRGKQVILMPDDDVPGATYAEKVAASLRLRDMEPRIVSFHDDGAKDLSEFIEAGHTADELVERIGSDWVAVGASSPFDAPAEFEPA